MREAPPSSTRLHRCIRDLATLNALPTMCIGRTPEEAFEIAIDALPTALSCELVHFTRRDGRVRASLRGKPLEGEALAALTQALAREPDEAGVIMLEQPERLWCLAVEVPIGSARGKLVAGKSKPLDLELDRVLVRSAANLVGTTLETANVLEAAKRKDEFLAMLGHELRNPLAPILTAVELLGGHTQAAREREVIERHTRHLSRLVDDLLDISRLERGHIELRQESLALSVVLERAIELASQLIQRNHHELVVNLEADVVVRGDPVRLAQVFGNLLTNAAKFTPAGGRIELSTAPGNGRVRVLVRDNGRGIACHELERIFEPFVQLYRITDAARGGLGLGLAIVKTLVDRHGGSIVAESQGPGTGATFTVELPIAMAAPDAPAGAPGVPERAPADAREERRGYRVLIVDDNLDVAELLTEALGLEGFETAAAHDGQSALERWRELSPHAGVLDVGLPDMDGYELARRLRAEHGAGPTLIAATGYGQPSDRERAAAAGFDCHLVKPVSVQDLVRALQARLSQRNG
ncbi:MAG TPA: ATP-binding protein [Polyangiaceae bacterium]|jgi:signal transduction histidine kinase/CheY-like chemotaxis protein|nr:ATP-binding protein [Polyangiaceae bacterium]